MECVYCGESLTGEEAESPRKDGDGDVMTTAATDADWLALIHADPGDPMPRLVYADWLDERGDPDGELVRLLCEVQRPGETDTCPECGGYGDEPDYDTTHDGPPAICYRCGGTGSVPGAAYQPGPAYDRLEAITGGLDAVIEQLSERDRRLFAYDARLLSDAAPDRAAERRWQLCRAVEYRLGFVLIRERGSDGTLYCRACGRE